MADMFMDGRSAMEVADELNLSPVRITQMRQKAREEFDGM